MVKLLCSMLTHTHTKLLLLTHVILFVFPFFRYLLEYIIGEITFLQDSQDWQDWIVHALQKNNKNRRN